MNNDMYRSLLMSTATLSLIEDIVDKCVSAPAAQAAQADHKAIKEIAVALKQLHEAKE